MSEPTVLIALDRRLVERLVPGAIAEAETGAQGFADSSERRAWVAGRLGLQLERALRAGAPREAVEVERLDELADKLAARLAARLPGAAGQEPVPRRLVDAAELAEILGVTRGTVYEHADELGGERLGGETERSPDKKHRGGSRLRFDPQTALEAWTHRSLGERSNGTGREAARGDTPQAARRPRRRTAAGLPRTGSVLKIDPPPADGRRGRPRASSAGEERETSSAA